MAVAFLGVTWLSRFSAWHGRHVSRRDMAVTFLGVTWLWRFSAWHGCHVSRRDMALAFLGVTWLWRFSAWHGCHVSRRDMAVTFLGVTWLGRFSAWHGCHVSRRDMAITFLGVTWLWRFSAWHGFGVSRRDMAVAFLGVTWLSRFSAWHGFGISRRDMAVTFLGVTWLWRFSAWHGFHGNVSDGGSVIRASATAALNGSRESATPVRFWQPTLWRRLQSFSHHKRLSNASIPQGVERTHFPPHPQATVKRVYPEFPHTCTPVGAGVRTPLAWRKRSLPICSDLQRSPTHPRDSLRAAQHHVHDACMELATWHVRCVEHAWSYIIHTNTNYF